MSESAAAIRKGAIKKSVPKFCATRWTARVCTLSAVLAKYPVILKAMDRIKEDSEGDARSVASSYIRLLEDPQFIVALTVAQVILSFLDPVTRALQAKDCNLADAYKDVSVAKECIRDARKNETWDKVWVKFEQIALSIGITVCKPCSHRANSGAAGSQTPSDYYRIGVYYPFIDLVVEELDTSQFEYLD